MSESECALMESIDAVADALNEKIDDLKCRLNVTIEENDKVDCLLF